MPSDLDLVVVKSGTRYQAKVVNVSQSGIAITPVAELGQGDIVTLISRTLRLQAQVVRIGGSTLGLKFSTLISNADLVILRRAVARAGAGWQAAHSHSFTEL